MNKALISPLKHCLFINLRSTGQVMFQENSLTGLLFIIAILWGTYSDGNIQIGFAGLAGLLISNLAAKLWHYDQASINQGLYGYNGVLVGLGIATFVPMNFISAIFIVIASILSTLVLKKPWRIPAFTFPFIVLTWISLAILFAIGDKSTSPVQLADLVISSHQFKFYLESLLHSFSQVFLIKNPITGFLFLIGLLINSKQAFLAALFAAVLALFLAFILESSYLIAIHDGLYGYSPILTAIAIVTFRPKSFLSSLPVLIIGTIITILVQFALGFILAPLGLPILTAPFVFATWITLKIFKH